MRRTPVLIILAAGLMASGCGLDAAGTAATVGKLEAERAQQAKVQEEQIKKKLDEVMKSTDAAASAAASQ